MDITVPEDVKNPVAEKEKIAGLDGSDNIEKLKGEEYLSKICQMVQALGFQDLPQKIEINPNSNLEIALLAVRDRLESLLIESQKKNNELDGLYKALQVENSRNKNFRERLKKSYLALQESRDAFMRADKFAFTGRIAAGIAHEIRNPLTNVKLSLFQIKKTLLLEKNCSQYFSVIERNIERINSLITELLNCARPPELDIRSHDMHHLIEELLESVKPKLKIQKIKLIQHWTPQSSVLKIDKDQMSRALLNLILNAIESMPKGGKLIIITNRNENHFSINIQNTGKGVPEKDLLRIFDPFFTTKSSGVGLGLTICYRIVSSHKGDIGVKSKPQGGTIFTVSFPLSQKLIDRHLAIVEKNPDEFEEIKQGKGNKMIETKWDIKRGAGTYRSVYDRRLKNWITTGKIKKGEFLVWRSGFSGWRKPEELPELKSFFKPGS